MTGLPKFQQIQYQFAAHIRQPDGNPMPDDIETRRMKIYTELFYNNVEDFMSANFPVLRELHTDEHWHALIRHYYSRHQARTPLFPEMAREFLYYLEYERATNEQDYPFMLELAHYEWVEAALYLADEEVDVSRLNPEGGLLNGLPVLSSLAWLLSYNYPVHRISPEFLPTESEQTPTHLLIYRDADSEIQFVELNPVTMKLLQMIKAAEYGCSEEILMEIATELKHPQPELVIQGGLGLLKDLQSRKVVLGIKD